MKKATSVSYVIICCSYTSVSQHRTYSARQLSLSVQTQSNVHATLHVADRKLYSTIADIRFEFGLKRTEPTVTKISYPQSRLSIINCVQSVNEATFIP